MTASRWKAVLPVLLVLAGTSVSCGDEGPPNPVPRETPEIPDPVEPGEVRRRVETRNPMGGRVGNLLVDGDFELSIVIQGTGPQSGWLAFGGPQSYLRGATGGVCRSGLRCGWLDPQTLLFGQGAAAKDTGMVATVWAKPPEGQGCSVLRAEVLRCNSFVTTAPLFPESDQPRPDGWCFYRGRIGEQSLGTCMLLESTTLADAILVDDAALVPDTGTTPLSSSRAIPTTTFRPLRGQRRERVRELIEWRRGRMKVGAPLRDRPSIGSL
jgi:hypothetical protein